MTVIEIIRPYLAQRRWTLSDLANAMKKSVSWVSVASRRAPADLAPVTLGDIAHALGISSDLFFEPVSGGQTTDRGEDSGKGGQEPLSRAGAYSDTPNQPEGDSEAQGANPQISQREAG